MKRVNQVGQVSFCYVKVENFLFERQQNMPLQNMPLWHKDYFELIIFEKEQAQENL